jgi:hypothetical protein
MAMTFSSVEIRCGGLAVSVQTELAYPDGLDDLCARSLNLFKEGVATAKANNIDITVMSLHTSDYGDDFDDED